MQCTRLTWHWSRYRSAANRDAGRGRVKAAATGHHDRPNGVVDRLADRERVAQFAQTLVAPDDLADGLGAVTLKLCADDGRDFEVRRDSRVPGLEALTETVTDERAKESQFAELRG